jgi:hypothetical protein
VAALIALIRAEASRDAPMIPGSWDCTVGPDRWSVIYPLGRVASPGVFFHARLVLRDGTNPQRAVFVCTGPRAVLDRLANAIAADALAWTRTWLTLAALRADASAPAVAIRNAWPDERPRDANGNPIGASVAHFPRVAGFEAEDAEEES